MKGIEDIEDSFSIDALIDILSNVQESRFTEVPNINLKDYKVPSPDSDHQLSTSFATYMDKLKELFPNMNDDQLFKLLLYTMADITYGNDNGDYLMLGQMAWSVSWGLFDEKYADELEIIKQQNGMMMVVIMILNQY